MGETRWRILHIDASQGLRPVAASGDAHLLVFWWRSLPLGSKAILPEETPFDETQMRRVCASLLSEQWHARHANQPLAGVDGVPVAAVTLKEAAAVTGQLAALDALAEPAAAPTGTLSVVVCTRDRPEMLRTCIASLEAQAVPPSQIVVVDNSVTGSARAVVDERPEVTYVAEPRPGLSIARNAGLAAARGQLVAFTDDDVELHPAWTAELGRAFEASEVDAVTGLVLPARLETPAQRAFELELGGFTQRCTPLLFDASFLDRTRHMGPQVWRIGAGANMAFRRSSLASWGGFDERLGAGAAGCSEDSEFWYRILSAGGVCLYEPRAVVFHHHRRDWRGLHQQYRAYMRGHVAALVAQYDRYGNRGDLRRIFTQLPAYFARTALKNVQNLCGWRLLLLCHEVCGWVLGLQYLLRRGWRDSGRPGRDAQEARCPEATSHRHA